jgi:hypothetical protein
MIIFYRVLLAMSLPVAPGRQNRAGNHWGFMNGLAGFACLLFARADAANCHVCRVLVAAFVVLSQVFRSTSL